MDYLSHEHADYAAMVDVDSAEWAAAAYAHHVPHSYRNGYMESSSDQQQINWSDHLFYPEEDLNQRQNGHGSNLVLPLTIDVSDQAVPDEWQQRYEKQQQQQQFPNFQYDDKMANG